MVRDGIAEVDDERDNCRGEKSPYLGCVALDLGYLGGGHSQSTAEQAAPPFFGQAARERPPQGIGGRNGPLKNQRRNFCRPVASTQRATVYFAAFALTCLLAVILATILWYTRQQILKSDLSISLHEEEAPAHTAQKSNTPESPIREGPGGSVQETLHLLFTLSGEYYVAILNNRLITPADSRLSAVIAVDAITEMELLRFLLAIDSGSPVIQLIVFDGDLAHPINVEGFDEKTKQ